MPLTPRAQTGASTNALAARGLTIEAAQSAGSARGFKSNGSARNVSSTQIKKLLDSRNDRDVLDGLRKVISVRGTSSCVFDA